MNKAFFLDKDGTLVDNSNYPKKIPTDKKLGLDFIPSDKLLEDDVIEGLKYIQKKGYKLFIVSNQPWITKGHLDIKEVESIFQNLVEKLRLQGIFIEEYFYCPHQTSDNCECKKPKPKMIFDAAKKYEINLDESYMVGDMDLDILTGQNAGTKTILVLTGCGKEFKNIAKPTYILKNLNEIIKIL
jgi:D-glycero-D-manno-heptose 1,7-bisphosphate phosphatase